MVELPIVQKEIKAKKPDWLRVKLPIGEEYKKVRKIKCCVRNDSCELARIQ